MGHKKAKSERKDEFLRLRVTAEQKQILIAAADQAGARGVSSWLLALGLRVAAQ